MPACQSEGERAEERGRITGMPFFSPNSLLFLFLFFPKTIHL